MFDMLTSKLGQAHEAFADTLGSLEALSMDRLRDEEERRENSRRDDLRQRRSVADSIPTNNVEEKDVEFYGRSHLIGRSPQAAASAPATTSGSNLAAIEESRSNRLRKENGPSVGSWRDLDLDVPCRQSNTELESVSSRDGLCAAQETDTDNNDGSTKSNDGSFAATGGGGREATVAGVDVKENFEDEFDPILASIRNPTKHQLATAATTVTLTTAVATSSLPLSARAAGGDATLCGSDCARAQAMADSKDRGKLPNVGVTFAAGVLSIFPGDMRARAGDVMAQSSAQISKSAGVLRSALESGGSLVTAKGSSKSNRRQRAEEYRADGVELSEEGQIKGSSRRTAGGGGARDGGGAEDNDVQLLSVNELLSEEERQQLAALSAGSVGGGPSACGCRRVRKYFPVVVGVALLGIVYLWRWKSLPEDVAGVAGEAGVVGAGRG